MNPPIILYNYQGFILKWIFHHGWKNFQIYSVQITEKYILWNFFLLVWSLVPVEQLPYKFSSQNLSPHKKYFFWKKSLLP